MTRSSTPNALLLSAVVCWLMMLSALSNVAQAQAPANRPPTPGRFDYYLLALSWSPTYCAEPRNAERDQAQCAGARRYAFVVHGLWPQYEKGWPSQCASTTAGPSPALVRQMLDIMPSPRLVEHQWAKHGTCTGLSAQAYFDLTRKLRAAIATPPAFAAPDKTLLVSAADVRGHFLAANRRLRSDGIAVSCRAGRLQEVRICLAKDGSSRACGADVRDRCEGQVRMPPVRAPR